MGTPPTLKDAKRCLGSLSARLFRACRIHLISSGFIVLLIGTALTSCSSEPTGDDKRSRHERARELASKERFRDALVEYENLAQRDPQDDEAHYQSALLHLKLGTAEDVHLAHQALLRVVRLKPSRIDAHLDLARFYLLVEEPARARLYADAVLAIQPMHPEGHLFRGQSLVREGKVQEGIAELQQAVDADPQSAGAYLELAKTYATRHKFADAESILRDGLRVNPRSVETRTALGDVLAAAGRLAEATAEYGHGLEMDPNNGALYVRVAALHQKQHRVSEAESVYRQWMEVVPHDVHAYVALGQFYQSTGQANEALTSFQRGRQVDPSSLFAHQALIAFYLETNRLAEAGREIDALLGRTPGDTAGRLLKARLRLEQGHTNEALVLLQEMARTAPRSAMVHQALGIVWARMHKPTEAIAALKEARSLAPESSEIRINLAQAYLSHGSWSLAIKEGEAAVRFNPQNAAALTVLGDAYLLAGNTRRAQQLFKEVAAATPHDPSIHQRLGVIARAQRHFDEALAHFEQAFEENPQFMDALDQIVATLVSEGKVRQARDRVTRQIESTPNEARLYNLLGQVLGISADFVEAEAAFKHALSIDGTLLSSYANLGELYARQGRTDRAIQEFETIVSRNPRHLAALMILGILHEQQGDFPRATTRYEEALRLNPRFAPAANNLAWILIERGGDEDRALSYAETAREAMPRDPFIADTLGWIYYHKQMYAKSASLLREAVDHLPEHPLILYHYGMAQYGNGNSAEAKRSLAKFLTLSPADAHVVQAKEVLAALS